MIEALGLGAAALVGAALLFAFALWARWFLFYVGAAAAILGLLWGAGLAIQGQSLDEVVYAAIGGLALMFPAMLGEV